jgi:chemotaxis protein MotB
MTQQRRAPETRENKSRARGKSPTWVITLADLSMLLFAFFVLMQSFSATDAGRYRAMADSMTNAFKDAGGGLLNITEKGTGATIQPTTSTSVETSATTAAKRAYENLNTALRREVSDGRVQVKLQDTTAVVSFSDTSYFLPGSERIAPEMIPVLERVANVLLASPNTKVIVMGHTDNVQISTERFRSNWELSSARAAAVVTELLRLAPIPANRIIAQGMADTRPLASNATPEGRAQNRRVEVQIVGEDGATTTIELR